MSALRAQLPSRSWFFRPCLRDVRQPADDRHAALTVPHTAVILDPLEHHFTCGTQPRPRQPIQSLGCAKTGPIVKPCLSRGGQIGLGDTYHSDFAASQRCPIGRAVLVFIERASAQQVPHLDCFWALTRPTRQLVILYHHESSFVCLGSTGGSASRSRAKRNVSTCFSRSSAQTVVNFATSILSSVNSTRCSRDSPVWWFDICSNTSDAATCRGDESLTQLSVRHLQPASRSSSARIAAAWASRSSRLRSRIASVMIMLISASQSGLHRLTCEGRSKGRRTAAFRTLHAFVVGFGNKSAMPALCLRGLFSVSRF